jgi:hypothetical protein
MHARQMQTQQFPRRGAREVVDTDLHFLTHHQSLSASGTIVLRRLIASSRAIALHSCAITAF